LNDKILMKFLCDDIIIIIIIVTCFGFLSLFRAIEKDIKVIRPTIYTQAKISHIYKNTKLKLLKCV